MPIVNATYGQGEKQTAQIPEAQYSSSSYYSNSNFPAGITDYGSNLAFLPVGYYVLGSDLKIHVTSQGQPNARTELQLERANGSVIYSWYYDPNVIEGYIALGYNEELGRAFCVKIAHGAISGGGEYYIRSEYAMVTGNNYTAIVNSQTPLIVYQWTSVPTISGKMGTLSLTEILNINDGEAVDDVGLSDNISLSTDSTLNAMIDAVMQEDSNVTVSYSIPDETYSYIKLVYKKDYIPTSYTDGTAIDITQSSTEKIISGIADGSTYWFVIFTDISESEPVSFDTVRTSWMGEEVILLYSGNSNTMTAQISDGHILFKFYSGENVIYSFNAYAGSTVSDANKIYVQFLKDDTNEIAKPSLVYFDGTNYSINQETPTDEQMSDIYTWLSASNQSI